MKRDLINTLLEWSKSKDRKPILIRGARQVGKSWLIRELGKNFSHYIELNFEENPSLESFFKGNLDPKEITTQLSNYLGIPIIPGKTLLFFDEIQACPRAITALRYFYEKMPDLHTIGAGSLIEFELQHISTPVGRIDNLYLYPMSFGEFLVAMGRENLRNQLKTNITQRLPDALHQQLLSFVRDYTIIGGMPAVIKKYIETQNVQECQKIQTGLIETFQKDFIKYAKRAQIKYLRLLFEAIPLQLGNKFTYSHISQEIKSREFSTALDLLEMAGVAHRVYYSSCAGIPLGAMVDLKKFKVMFFDIGLAQRILGIDIKPLFLTPDITPINKGALAELLVGLEFMAYSDPYQKAKLHYWQREKRGSQSEVDYVISLFNQIIPVEVKSGSHGRLYSLHRFIEEKKAKYGIKISKNTYTSLKKVIEVPFYGIESILATAQKATMTTI